MGRVFGAEMDCGNFLFAASSGAGRKFGLDKAFEVGEGLLGVDEEGEGFDVFVVAVVVADYEGEDEFEEAGGCC